MKLIIILFGSLLIIFVLSGCQKPSSWKIYSPNEKLTVIIDKNKSDETLQYSVTYKTETGIKNTVLPSKLGIIREDAAFTDGLKVLNSSLKNGIDYTYELIGGKRLKNNVQANRLTLALENSSKNKVNLVFEVFNDGVGFRYEFPDKNGAIFQVNEELTEFALPATSNAWIQPYDTLNTWSPAYEYGYGPKMKAGTAPPLTTGWGFPALFENDEMWVLLTETGIDGSYCGSHLAANCSNGVYRIEYPFSWENYGLWEAKPANSLPWATPWRLILIGDRLGAIAESNLVYHLAKPCDYEDVSWIKPGISSWNWWGDHGGGWKFNSLKKYIDFSAEMGWPYSLVDAEWQRMEGGTFEELAKYAKSKNVGLFIWYNSGGEHSRVMDALPRDLMHKPEVRMAEMKRIKEMGIKGIKVDFFQGEKQGTINLYLDIIKDAAKNQLMVVTHGCTIPRGWFRTYPNLVSMEAVRGGELYSYYKYPEEAVYQNTVLPFTRNVLGSMDFTPVTFDDYSPEIKHLTSNAHELALSLVFESGIQHFADRVESYRLQPAAVIDFLKNIPTVWDNTCLIDGYPGELAVIARKKDDKIYIGGISSLKEKRSLSFKVPFLEEGKTYTIKLIKDGASEREFSFDTITLPKDQEITIDLLPAGGFVGAITIK